MTGWRKYDPRKYPQDCEAVRAIFERQMKLLGMNFQFPALEEAPFVMVYVHETDGVVDNAFTIEAVAELTMIADKLLPLEEYAEIHELVGVGLKERGFKLVRGVLPSKVVVDKKNGKPGAMRRLMRKIRFTEEIPGLFSTFYRWL